jgi:hypothetical protein
MNLKYPDDRVNGFVQLSLHGNPYVSDCRQSGDFIADAMRFSGAFLVLSRRLDRMREGAV